MTNDYLLAFLPILGTVLVSNFPYFGKMTLLGKEVVDVMAIQYTIPGKSDVTVV
ncbi:unnamed protein product, partial [Allacma fusca]